MNIDAQSLLRRGIVAQSGPRRIFFRLGVRHGAQHGQIESFFIAEVIIDRGDVCPGFFADLAHGGGAITEVSKNLTGGFKTSPFGVRTILRIGFDLSFKHTV